MLDQAGKYLHDKYGARTGNLPGLLSGLTSPRPLRTAEANKEEGEFKVHAGIFQTSRILFSRQIAYRMTMYKLRPILPTFRVRQSQRQGRQLGRFDRFSPPDQRRLRCARDAAACGHL
ncbi:hypothetical protein [Massilia psychrophila]|uniref:Uncharacterized protein n=1 Tax=Massilia psychrophila TaxID=1603353 RepID=A0A2G8T145_9BURK|nr:hypothetical protein [Massilia psychrophila]PIL39724.1 hypothetical protein CR103_11585 [Massilia psychrophila]GGE85375.1 hypothetical protein GCM10008020_32750 [Massilia psychrophila]